MLCENAVYSLFRILSATRYHIWRRGPDLKKTMSIGQLREFDRTKESFEAYIERLENFMKANGVKSENQVAVLLTAIGPETYGLLRNLLTPEKPDARLYEELVEILNSHLHPKPLVIAARFNFHNRFRNDSESVADFAAQLRLTASSELSWMRP